MNEGPAPAAAGAEPVSQHHQHGGEILAQQRSVGPSAADQRIELVLVPLLSGDLGDDLLRQDIERLLREDQPVELAAAHTVEQRGALDELIA